ncbi:hypothetical protein ONZ45_g19241 [Pleurotus djamor]|nr:hypothetical protein ONZ45_g19241 [Pleurotus djamor]
MPRKGSSWLVNPKSPTEANALKPEVDSVSEPHVANVGVDVDSSSFIEWIEDEDDADEIEEEEGEEDVDDEDEAAGEPAREEDADVDGIMRTRILPSSEGMVSKEISKSPKARRASVSMSANSSRFGRLKEGLGVGMWDWSLAGLAHS